MVDYVQVSKRAMELVLERTMRVMQDTEEAIERAKKQENPQEKMRALFDELSLMPADEYEIARDAFDRKFGPEEYTRQETLGLRRQDKDNAG